MASVALIPSLSWLAWAIFSTVLATIGGVFVYLGLDMEHSGSKQKPPDELKIERGWGVLMWGIRIEIVAAGVLALASVYEGIKTSNKIASVDPRNQPVSTVEAIAMIEVKDPRTLQPDFSFLNETHMELMGSNLYEGGVSFFSLVPTRLASEYRHGGPWASWRTNYLGIGIEFEQNPVPAFEFDDWTNYIPTPKPTVKESFDNIHAILMYINFIPKEDKIVGNRVLLRINGFEKEFKIPEQDTAMYSIWNPQDKGIYIFATNEP